MVTMDTDLIIFEENLTLEGLKHLQEQASTWPTRALNKPEYELVYSEHQRMKKLRQLVTKKKTELINEEKVNFENAKKKIDNDYITVMAFLEPIENKLALARELWDAEIAAYKEKEAREEADRQRKEQERQQFLRDWIHAHEENQLFDERKKLEREKAVLEAEKQKIQCLNFDDALEDAQEFIGFYDEARKEFIDSAILIAESDSQKRENDEVNPCSISFPKGTTGDMVYPDRKKNINVEIVRIESIKSKVSRILNDLYFETHAGFKNDKVQFHILNFIDQVKNFIENFPED